ncbi:hypothetical protein [Lysinibacillus sp. TE18511]
MEYTKIAKSNASLRNLFDEAANSNFKQLTLELIHKMSEKPIVHERDTSTQKIEIHYSFGLGKLIITEDELIKQEKIRKTKKQYDHKCDQYCLFVNISL